MQKIFRKLAATFFLFFVFFPSAAAVMPPDFLFQIGSQIAQFFSVLFLFLTGIFGTFFHFFRARWTAIKNKKIFFVGIIFLIGGISLGAASFFDRERQKVEYEKWLKESENQNNIFQKQIPPPKKNEISEKTPPPEKNDFFEKNKNEKITISNEDFAKILKSGRDDFIVLDARENIEREIGYFPKSVHIRSADLKSGEWKKLPKDKFILVYCWSGIRGKEVAEFLRSKNRVAISLKKGAKGWVKFGGDWIGDILFSKKFPDKKHKIVFSTEKVKKYVSDGVFLVDSRPPKKYNRSPIPGSINISILSLSTKDYENAFKKIPKGKKVITICDDYVNCFDAKVTGVELERRGYHFLGRYNKPWDYGK